VSLPAFNRIDAAFALALSLLAATLALWTDGRVLQSGSRPAFYQHEFAPAVMFACGKGFHNVDWVNHDPALAAFLLQSRDTLRCGEISATTPVPHDSFQRISVYLELAVGLTWRAAGVSWGAVTWLGALLVIVIYLIFVKRLKYCKDCGWQDARAAGASANAASSKT